MTLESEVLKKVKPTKAQDAKVMAAVRELEDLVRREAKRLDAFVDLMLVGSVAKSTHLRDPDIDMFMLFPESTSQETLKEKGLAIGKAVLGGREHYAQHPYVRGDFAGFQVDLVPCFKIMDTRKKMSAVDRTPFHTRFVKANLADGQADQVRLLKRLMKGIGCYGAEAKVQGFSGYLCELLVMRFGGFRQVLEAASEWKKAEHIELPGHEGKEFPEPLTFIDPVDTSRNVASAVSIETLLLLIRASREYLRSPSERFFFPAERPPWPPAKVKDAAGGRLENIVSVSFPKIDLIDDVVYPQLRKSLAAAVALLERQEFEIEKTSIHVDGLAHLVIELASMSLPEERKHRGPPEKSENAKEFLAKWRKKGLSPPFVEDGRWYVIAKRDVTRGDDLLRKELRSLSLGKDVKKVAEFSVLSGPEMLDKAHIGALTEHFDERVPWER
ncbi:MAG: CCA-adding enzyme [Candidatus Thermoplasmatota archaeon]|nr:CCA-adding enzyme [Candidatus Thermoplasmatota archaeon]